MGRRDTETSESSNDSTIIVWDFENRKPAKDRVTVDGNSIEKVRQRFFCNDPEGKDASRQHEGCVIEMNGGAKYECAEVASEIRRRFHIIERQPEGSETPQGLLDMAKRN